MTSIGGNLWISNNDVLTSLTGLDNVTSIGGYLRIGSNDTLTGLTGLDNLTSIGGMLFISSNPMLISLSGIDNLYLSKPIKYKDMVYTLLNSDFVVTDSGGIQEEAVSLGKNVLILREKTERPEGVDSGFAFLVGTDPEKIKKMMAKLLKCTNTQANNLKNVYGDGYAAEKIVSICLKKMVNPEKEILGFFKNQELENSKEELP